MLKKAIVVSISVFIFLGSFASISHASIHTSLPSMDESMQYDLAYYESKQDRCLLAFTQSEFEMAYTICTPLANLGFKDAQLITGLLYAYGQGVDKDLNRAKIWLKEALKNDREEAAQALTQFDLD